MKPLLWFLTLTLLFAVSHPRIAAGQYYFDSWTTENGLPQNSIDAILQTRDGYLWIATADGLVRYDGVQFRVFNRGNTPGINDNRCLRLLEDRAGVLWIQNQFGLMSYRDGEFHSYTVDDGLPERISAFFEDSGGFIMVSNAGLIRWRDGRSSRIPNEGGNPRGALAYQDKSGSIWFNVDIGLIQLTRDGRSILHASPPGYTGNAWARRAYEDSKGNFWLGTNTGFYKVVDENKITPYEVKGGPGRSPITSICEDARERLWVGTEPAGLFQIPIVFSGAAPEANVIAYNPRGAPANNYIDCIF